MQPLHLHQGGGLHGGLLPDLCLHAVADVPRPHHLVAQVLDGRRPQEGAPQVDTAAHQLWGDGGSGGQGWNAG